MPDSMFVTYGQKMHLLQPPDGADSMFISFGQQHQIDLQGSNTGPRTCDGLGL
jgi:hypothetical protein